MLDHLWVPVGQGVKKREEVDALAIYLFDDEQGEEELLELDARIGKLPGLSGIKLMSKALYAARERIRRNPKWAWRLIENEGWAVKPQRKSPAGELTTRRWRWAPSSLEPGLKTQKPAAHFTPPAPDPCALSSCPGSPGHPSPGHP